MVEDLDRKYTNVALEFGCSYCLYVRVQASGSTFYDSRISKFRV